MRSLMICCTTTIISWPVDAGTTPAWTSTATRLLKFWSWKTAAATLPLAICWRAASMAPSRRRPATHSGSPRSAE